MRDGEPLSWRHFTYGLSHLPRAYARDSLRLAAVLQANATGMGHTPKAATDAWWARMGRAAGWE